MTQSSPSSDDHDEFEVELTGFPSAVESATNQAREGVEIVVSRFADELRVGKNPTIEAYCRQYPHHKDELLELLPLVMSLEHWSVDKEVECVRSTIPENFSIEEIGRYRVVREIGRGGMGIVFEAIEKDTQNVFAIKLLPLRNVSDVERRKDLFRREAATINRLRHQHIVPVHSFGSYQGYTYYVMDLIEGVSLDRVLGVLRQTQQAVCIADLLPSQKTSIAFEKHPLSTIGPESWKSFAKMGVQVALALAHAHSKGVLHNDIKPANLLIDRTGHVTVTDFGVGQGAAQPEATHEGHAPGTLRYMAPERLGGKFDARSDVYSLGATLYELLTQAAMFDSDDRQKLLESVLKERPKLPRDWNPNIPEPLQRIVLKAVEKDPLRRFKSADELRAELLRFINDKPLLTRGPTLWRRLWRRLRRQ